jgi:exodeoxyribonuclease VII large subunit
VAQVRIYPVQVQGQEAPAAIRAALARGDRDGWADLLILARGGGSLEDLQAFNEESVARSVAATILPVICAVGHETDFSICDFVADLRAPTPSAAAELAAPDQQQLKVSLSRYAGVFRQLLNTRLQNDMQRLDYLSHRLSQRDPVVRLGEQKKQLAKLEAALQRATRARLLQMDSQFAGLSTRLRIQRPDRKLAELRQRVDACRRTSRRSLCHHLEISSDRLRTLSRTLNAVSPLATLGRGYAVLAGSAPDDIITSTEQVSAGDQVTAQLANGRLYCTVDSVSGEAPDFGQPLNESGSG